MYLIYIDKNDELIVSKYKSYCEAKSKYDSLNRKKAKEGIRELRIAENTYYIEK